MRKTVVTLTLVLASVASVPALAGEMPTFAGTWQVTFFEDPGRLLGGIQCIVAKKVAGAVSGLHRSGTWQSPSFPGWHGQWVQTGDQVRWFGETGTGLATEESGNVIAKELTGGVSFNHFSKKDGSSSTSGSWFAVKVKGCKNGADRGVGKDPAMAGGGG